VFKVTETDDRIEVIVDKDEEAPFLIVYRDKPGRMKISSNMVDDEIKEVVLKLLDRLERMNTGQAATALRRLANGADSWTIWRE